MRESIDQFNHRTINVIGALVLRGIEQKHYYVASDNYYAIEMPTEVETGSSLVYWAHYPTDPGSLELLRLQTVFDDLISQHCLGQAGHYACSWTLNGIPYIEA